MADLSAQIREKVSGLRKNAQRRGIEADEERNGRLALLADDSERLADALLAVLDCDPTTRQVNAVAKALGIETVDD